MEMSLFSGHRFLLSILEKHMLREKERGVSNLNRLILKHFNKNINLYFNIKRINKKISFFFFFINI